jgi:hypothetical protein
MPRNRAKRPCAYPDCNAWAPRDSAESLCAAHAHLAAKEAGPEPEDAIAATERRTHGGQPGNQNRLVHGFYRRTLRAEDVDDLGDTAKAAGLSDKALIARLALRRTLVMLYSGTTWGEQPRPLEVDELIRIIGLAFQGARTVARHLAIRRTTDPVPDPGGDAIDTALDELSEEWGVVP